MATSVQATPEQFAQRLVESSVDGILAFDRECRYTVWNPGMERISGVPSEKVVGRRAFELFPFLVETGEDKCFHEALAGRTCVSSNRPYVVAESGKTGIFEGHYAPLHGADGSVVGGLAVIRDITERHQAENERIAIAQAEAARLAAEASMRRFAFLAKAGEVLARSLDVEQTLRDLAALAIPELGDMCIVDVLEDGEIRRLATEHLIPSKRVLLDQLRREYAPTLDSPQPAARAVRTGSPDLLPHVSPDDVAARTRSEPHARLIREIGIRSHLAVPMMARGTTIGVISVGITESDRRYGATDVEVAMELAHRAALALDNARLYRAAQREIAHRAQAEEALRLSEERFRAVMEQSPLSTQVLVPGGRRVRVNRAWEALWGTTLDRIPDNDVFHDRQLEKSGVLAYLRRAFEGEAVEIPARPYHPNDVLPDDVSSRAPMRWVRAFAYPIKDGVGGVREVVLVQEDVTARVSAETQLRESEERLRVAMQGARVNVWDWDLRTQAVYTSENGEEFWGIRVGQSSDFMAVVKGEDRAAVDEAARRAIKENVPHRVEYRIVRPDGTERWVESRGRVVFDDSGAPLRIIGVTVDITEQKVAEEATRVLADAGESLGASLDAEVTLNHLARVIVPRLADYCVIDLVVDGEIRHAALFHRDQARMSLVEDAMRRWQPANTSAIGVQHVARTSDPQWASVITDEMLQVVAQDAEHLAVLRNLGLSSYVCVPLVARGVTLGVLTLIHAESRRRYREEDVALVRDLARRAASAVDNARLYQQLREEDRRKEEFLATLAHELRNPLAPLRTGLDLLAMAPSTATIEKTRVIMHRQVEHMVRLVDDLLDLSRVTRGTIELQREVLDASTLIDVAREVSEPTFAAAGVSLRAEIESTPLYFSGDRVRLAQVLTNVLNNAAKYTPRGGEVQVTAARDGADILFRVRDTGVGIPRDMLERVFEMFAQVRRGDSGGDNGLGIGLTLVRRLVELHGGHVHAESEGPGRGATIVIRLPSAAPAGSSNRPSTSPPAPRLRQRRRVLVVDDNRDAADMLALLLSGEGHDVRIAANGKAALELAHSFAPEVAFLDIGLPGMNGYDLARAFRAIPEAKETLLVALTGWGQATDRERAKAAGFDLHLTKPADVHEVNDAIDSRAPPRRN